MPPRVGTKPTLPERDFLHDLNLEIEVNIFIELLIKTYL